MTSQSSTQTTIPYELSQDADETFISELESVDQLYFQNHYVKFLLMTVVATLMIMIYLMIQVFVL